ncbi:MAG: hypothetical protein P4N41_18225 [Negativicutes bacterium]|nr:hypothetical protein [Negativicutes bacterium]
MSDTTKYIGKWIDDFGRILLIREYLGATVVDYYRNEREPIERSLPANQNVPSLNMNTYSDDSILVVELGLEGVGPTLRLDIRSVEGNDVLWPSVECGLYDDWEDDFGVPWIFPLSIYRRSA